MKVFLSYSHRDTDALERLNVHLAVLKKERQIDVWYDHEILAGSDIDCEISEKLESSDLILLLVSPDFLASDYCTNKEMSRALERHHSGDARVVPIILEPCDWINSPLGRLKALPKDARPISAWNNKNDAFTDVVQELRRILNTEKSCFTSHEESTKVAEFEEFLTPQNKTDYRVKREFNVIDVSCFRDDTFRIIADYFEQSAVDIGGLPDVSARFVHRSSTCFVCTVINSRLTHGTAHITVRLANEGQGLGDLSYSFRENASANEANGMYFIQSDDYELFLKFWMDSGERDEKLSPVMVAQELWKKFLEQAGITKT